jgi:hypothetical protein
MSRITCLTTQIAAVAQWMGKGRGFTEAGVASGRFQGFWELVDGVVVMRNVVNITNGTMNLDVIEFNPLTEELMVKAYILK